MVKFRLLQPRSCLALFVRAWLDLVPCGHTIVAKTFTRNVVSVNRFTQYVVVMNKFTRYVVIVNTFTQYVVVVLRFLGGFLQTAQTWANAEVVLLD